MLPGMDFHTAFQAIDTDNSGEITIEELQEYCKKMNYKESFVQKWLNLFDEDQSGTITYEEFCNTLGLIPKKEVVEQHKTAAAGGGDAGGASSTSQQQQQQQQRQGRSRNKALSGSLMQYSRARMFQRKALYRLKAKKPRQASTKRSPASGDGAALAAKTKEKQVGGDKNGGTRRVPGRRAPKSLPTRVAATKRRPRPAKTFAQHRRRLRPSITPGAVLILLAGRHRGKRVVFLKQLASGLLLVTGPVRLNGCPLRRVGQKFVIATRTRLRLRDCKLPDRLTDQYFRRAKNLKKASGSKDSADIFQQQQQSYQLSAERKEDQKAVDTQVMSAIAQREDKKLMMAYLKSLFSLKSGQRPHEMVF